MTDREKAIVMAYTGCTMLAGDKLGIYYQYVQEKLGRSVMTHELAYEEVQDAIEEAAKENFIAIAKDINVPGKWVKLTGMAPPEYHGHKICSVCKSFAPYNPFHPGREMLSPYCPGCGAKMEVQNATD